MVSTYLRQSNMGELLKRQFVFLTLSTVLLTFKYPSCGYRGNAHPVSKEENHVLSNGDVRFEVSGFLDIIGAAVKPKLSICKNERS